MATDRWAIETVRELVLRARRDTALWEGLKENERRLEEAEALGEELPENALDVPGMPQLAMMVADFVDRYYEVDEDFDYGLLMFVLRCFVRKDLGLPVEVEWEIDEIPIHELH